MCGCASHVQDLGTEATTRPFCSGGVALCRGSLTAIARYDHAVATDSAGGVRNDGGGMAGRGGGSAVGRAGTGGSGGGTYGREMADRR